MIAIKKQSLSETFSIYLDKRMLRILLLGAISGFPWVLIGSSLSLWLKEEGLSRSTIGWAGLIFAVYAFNYLWAPLVDRLRIPYLTKKLGHRRGWIVLMQIAILICLITWSFINPTENLALLITVGLIIAIASATQDITVDALRIEQIGVDESKSMAAGAAMAVVGWWSGYHRRSRVETKMHCVKLLGQSLMAWDFDRQVAEIQVRIAVLNRYTALGIPVTEPVG